MAGVLQDVAVGGFLPIDSPIHRLDPRVKLLGSVLLMLGVLFTNEPAGLIANCLAVIGIAALCRAGFSIWLRSLSRFSWMLVIVAVVHLFFHPGDLSRANFGGTGSPVTSESLWASALFVVRLAEIIVLSMALTFTTAPSDLTKGCVRIARPLKRVNVRVEEIGLVLMLAMRFVPLLQYEIRCTVESQKARGVRFGQGDPLSRARTFVAVLVPALVGAIGRADLLATAMTARGFTPGAPRSEHRPLKFKRTDYAATAAVIAFFLCQVTLFG